MSLVALPAFHAKKTFGSHCRFCTWAGRDGGSKCHLLLPPQAAEYLGWALFFPQHEYWQAKHIFYSMRGRGGINISPQLTLSERLAPWPSAESSPPIPANTSRRKNHKTQVESCQVSITQVCVHLLPFQKETFPNAAQAGNTLFHQKSWFCSKFSCTAPNLTPQS